MQHIVNLKNCPTLTFTKKFKNVSLRRCWAFCHYYICFVWFIQYLSALHIVFAQNYTIDCCCKFNIVFQIVVSILHTVRCWCSATHYHMEILNHSKISFLFSNRLLDFLSENKISWICIFNFMCNRWFVQYKNVQICSFRLASPYHRFWNSTPEIPSYRDLL